MMACMLTGVYYRHKSGWPVIISALLLQSTVGGLLDQMHVAYFVDLCATHSREMCCLDLLR